MILLLVSCQAQSQFIDSVLTDINTSSAYIAVNIKSNEFTGKAIIENVDLFRFLYEKYDGSLSKYSAEIKRVLIHSDTLLIGDNDIMEIGFLKVSKIRTVDDNAQNEVSKFIDIYFKNGFIKKSVSEDEKIAIIDKLFTFNISTRLDDESGY